MKSIVIYYSQAGSTKIIAQAIQKGIAQKIGQCDIARLREIQPEELVKYDLIGIGSPTWSSSPTPNVIDFEKSLPPTLKGKHFFFYCTHGVLPGRCVLRGVQPLQEQGLTVIGWKDWYAAANLSGHPKPYFTDGHPDAIDIAEAESFGLAMANHSLQISQGATDLIPTLPSPEAADEFYGLGHPFIRPAMEEARKAEGWVWQMGEKKINKEKCIGCMLCAQNCWSNHIDASVTPPVFKTTGPCEDSYCEYICPTGAIEVDFGPPGANFGPLKVMAKQLSIAEAKGRFRRLVRDEDIGWHTPFELVTKHPRLKVP
jgi:menaquinone-dependent protoporphyrinogen IX oxidase/NAD-dependent dihydropyrimidine dehydrogenase PreA subunit